MRVAGRPNRRRLLVFLGTLSVMLAVSLAFTWLRPAEYRASARLEITPGIDAVGPAASGSASPSSEPSRPFLTEVQVLVSRPVLEEVATRLERSGEDLSTFGAETVAGMQARIQALPVAETHVVELVATGKRPELLAPLVNTVVEVYQGRLAEAYRRSTGQAIVQADDEVTKLEQTVEQKRLEVEAFRLRNNIVSLERDENEVLARVRNLSTSLSAANDKVAAAEGKVRALGASAAAGKGAVRARDDPTLASLEQRASQMREELRDLERGFTSEYLEKDPKVVTQRTRLAELERQITEQRAISRQNAVLEAQDELASVQSAAARVRQEMVASRAEAAQFTTRFNQYKALQAGLDELEKAQREAVQRRAKLAASESARTPSIRVLEAATTPQEPWRPLYWRDTAISVGGSLVIALLAVWLVELFNRPEPHPSVVLIQPQPGAVGYYAPQALPAVDRGAPSRGLESAEPALLPRQPRFPRELRPDEVAALVRAAEGVSRTTILLLLSGIDLDELVALRWRDLDPERGVVHVDGEPGRDVAVDEALRPLFEAAGENAPEGLVIDQLRGGATQDTVDADILCAAHDAALEEPAQVTSACLRHTYLAFLVRQGIRFADLTRLVGPLPAEVVAAYSALSPPGTRLGSGQAQLIYPALREATA